MQIHALGFPLDPMDSSDGEAFNGGGDAPNQGAPSAVGSGFPSAASYTAYPRLPSSWTLGGSGFPAAAASTEYPRPPSSWTLGHGLAGYPAASQPFVGSGSNNPIHAFSTLDLNAGNSWPDMNAYASYISSGHDVSAVQAPPPLRLPSHSTAPRSGADGPRSDAEEGGGTGTGVRGRTRRSPRVRGPSMTISGDNFDSAWTPPPPPPRVTILIPSYPR